jgi:hypothetical protein
MAKSDDGSFDASISTPTESAPTKVVIQLGDSKTWLLPGRSAIVADTQMPGVANALLVVYNGEAVDVASVRLSSLSAGHLLLSFKTSRPSPLL